MTWINYITDKKAWKQYVPPFWIRCGHKIYIFWSSGEIRIFSFEGWYCCFLSFFSPSFFTFVLLSHFCQRPDVHAPHVLFCIFLPSFLKNCCRTHFRRLIHVIGIFAWHFSPEIAHSTDWYRPQCLDNISKVVSWLFW